MDTVTVNGKVYKKATLLAKQFRYTTDYIGQLCRSKKVDCQFVGRSWYVTEASLLAHKDTRYKEVRLDEKTIKNNGISAKTETEVAVHPRLLKTVQKAKPKAHFAERLIPRESKYFADEADLLPVPTKAVSVLEAPLKKIIPVIPDAAKNLPVQSQKAKEKLDFTELPAVSLNGTLKVEEIVADETPSVPVVVPEPKEVVVATTRPVAAIPEPPKTSLAPTVTEKITYTPKQVTVATGNRGRLSLVLLALLSSLLFFGFVVTASEEFFVTKNSSAKRVIFEVEPVKNFAQNLR